MDWKGPRLEEGRPFRLPKLRWVALGNKRMSNPWVLVPH